MATTGKTPKAKIRLKYTLPRRFASSPGLLASGDVKVNGGRLRAKVLVFDKPANLKRFWQDGLHKGPLGKRCLGAVNALGWYVARFSKAGEVRTIESDHRYFCVIGLVVGHLSMRIISHESVHAAFAFANRKSRAWWDQEAKKNDEEAIAYPVGEIASGIVTFLIRAKLLEPGQRYERKKRRK